MKKNLTTVIIACVAASFYQCSPSTDQKVAEARNAIGRDISKEKQDVVNDLRWLRDDINDRLDEVSIKIDDASDKSKDGLDEAKLNLMDQRAKVEKSLNEIDRAADARGDHNQQKDRDSSHDVKME